MFKNLKKPKPEMIFIAVGILLLALVATVVACAINFLLAEMKITLSQEGRWAQEITRFNLEGLKKIGLVSNGQSESASGGGIATTTPMATTTSETGATATEATTTIESATTSKLQ